MHGDLDLGARGGADMPLAVGVDRVGVRVVRAVEGPACLRQLASAAWIDGGNGRERKGEREGMEENGKEREEMGGKERE